MFRDDCNVLAGIITAILLSLGLGCSKSDPSRYIPSPKVAEEALRAALEAWRDGQPAGTVKSYQIPIQVADAHRLPGQKLKSFEILGEVSVDGGRRFQVRLDLENPEAQEKVQYIVVGIDPLWVFRREDYDMITHWEHPMPASEGPAAEGPAEGAAADGTADGAASSSPTAPSDSATVAPPGSK